MWLGATEETGQLYRKEECELEISARKVGETGGTLDLAAREVLGTTKLVWFHPHYQGTWAAGCITAVPGQPQDRDKVVIRREHNETALHEGQELPYLRDTFELR